MLQRTALAGPPDILVFMPACVRTHMPVEWCSSAESCSGFPAHYCPRWGVNSKHTLKFRIRMEYGLVHLVHDCWRGLFMVFSQWFRQFNYCTYQNLQIFFKRIILTSTVGLLDIDLSPRYIHCSCIYGRISSLRCWGFQILVSVIRFILSNFVLYCILNYPFSLLYCMLDCAI